MRTNLAVGCIVLAAAVGASLGGLWVQSRRDANAEDVVAAEFRLLDRYRSVPTCEQIKAASDSRGEVRVDGAIVHWRLRDGRKRLSRVVVADDLTVAYDELDTPCVSPTPPTR